MVRYSKWAFFHVICLAVCTWCILAYADNSDQDKEDFHFIRFSRGGIQSNLPILHEPFPEGESFYLLKNDESVACQANSRGTFQYEDEVAYFNATILDIEKKCEINDDFLIAVHTNRQPEYTPLSEANFDYKNYSTPDNEDVPLVYYQKTKTNFGLVELYIFNLFHNKGDGGREILVVVDGELLDKINIGWGHAAPRPFYLNDRLFIVSYFLNEGAGEVFAVDEISPEGIHTVYTNSDYSI